MGREGRGQEPRRLSLEEEDEEEEEEECIIYGPDRSSTWSPRGEPRGLSGPPWRSASSAKPRSLGAARAPRRSS